MWSTSERGKNLEFESFSVRRKGDGKAFECGAQSGGSGSSKRSKGKSVARREPPNLM